MYRFYQVIFNKGHQSVNPEVKVRDYNPRAKYLSPKTTRTFLISIEMLQEFRYCFFISQNWLEFVTLSRQSKILKDITSPQQISTIIPGVRTAEQVDRNTQRLKQLSDADKNFLQSLSTEWEPVVQLMEHQG